MGGKLKWIFTLLFATTTIWLLAQRPFYTFGELKYMAEVKPDSAVYLINNLIKTYPKRDHYKLNYLHALASYNSGNYIDTDSLYQDYISTLGSNVDSSLFYNFLTLAAKEKKIQGNMGASLDLLLRAKRYYERKKDTTKCFINLTDLLEFYRAAENTEDAYSIITEAEFLLNNYKNISEVHKASYFGRKAAFLIQFEANTDSTSKLMIKVIEIAKRINNQTLLASSSNELGYIYHNIKNPLAEKLYKDAANIYKRLSYDRYLVNVQINLARFYWYEKEYKEATSLLDSVIANATLNNYENILGDAKVMKGYILKDLERADEGFALIDEGRMHLNNYDKQMYSSDLAEISAKYQVEKTKKELNEQRNETKLAMAEASAKQSQKNLFLFSLVGTAVVFIVTLFFFLKTRQQNQRLKEQQDQIFAKNMALNNEVKANESLLQEVNHRVKNNLSVLSGLMYLQQTKLENEEAIEALKDSQDRITTISLIHESLYQHGDMSIIQFQGYLEKLVSYIKDSFNTKQKNVQIKIECEALKMDLSNSIPLAMLVNELVTNSFKYAFKEVESPELGIKYDKQKNILEVYDNGPGVEEEDFKKESSLGSELILIFAEQIKAQFKNYKTENYYVNEIKFNNPISTYLV